MMKKVMMMRMMMVTTYDGDKVATQAVLALTCTSRQPITANEVAPQ